MASALPAAAVMPVGAEGMVYGVLETMLEGVEVPNAFCAITSKSYDWPFVREVTEEEAADEVVVAYKAKVELPVKRSYKRYWVMPDPPVELGADQERETDVLCGVATRFCGAVGAVATLTDVVAVLVPFAFVAVIV